MIRESKLSPASVERLPQLIKRFEEAGCVQAMYLFGSLVRGQLNPLSDLDLAVLLDHNLSREQLFQQELDLVGHACDLLGTDEIDLVVLNNAPPRIAYRILQTGRLAFVKDKKQLSDFTDKTVKIFLDFEPRRKAFDQAFMRGIGLHG